MRRGAERPIAGALVAALTVVLAGCGGDASPVAPPRHLRAALHPPPPPLTRMMSAAGMARLRLVWDPSTSLLDAAGGRYVVYRVSGERLDVRKEVASVPHDVHDAYLPLTLFLLSIFGGLTWAGVMGLFYGPVIMLLLMTTIQIYTERYAKEDGARLATAIGGLVDSREEEGSA